MVGPGTVDQLRVSSAVPERDAGGWRDMYMSCCTTGEARQNLGQLGGGGRGGGPWRRLRLLATGVMDPARGAPLEKRAARARTTGEAHPPFAVRHQGGSRRTTGEAQGSRCTIEEALGLLGSGGGARDGGGGLENYLSLLFRTGGFFFLLVVAPFPSPPPVSLATGKRRRKLGSRTLARRAQSGPRGMGRRGTNCEK